MECQLDTPSAHTNLGGMWSGKQKHPFALLAARLVQQRGLDSLQCLDVRVARSQENLVDLGQARPASPKHIKAFCEWAVSGNICLLFG